MLSIVDSWQDTLPDEDILQLLRNWNAGAPSRPPTPPGPSTTISRGEIGRPSVGGEPGQMCLGPDSEATTLPTETERSLVNTRFGFCA